ncbi:MAG TPA: SDR family NAD(P)-dependent oxidoreductase [Kofleriaceae bacterium]|nr:SDR family NAD(P)-dependent oxidoreductase [Kofleriaceae bacterium]
MKLTGRTILITGGSSGIGLALAKRFVELGNEVIITGRNRARLDAARQATPQLQVLCSDAADPVAIAELARTVKHAHPELDVLVNNAGVMTYRNLAHPGEDLAGLTSEVDTNVAGPVRLVAALIEQLQANHGTIINVSSGLAFVPLTAAPIYSATKAFMHAYTITLRQQLAPHGVEVIELMPPAVRTELAAYPDDPSFKVISTDELVARTFKALHKGKLEICPGQAGGLRFMSRMAPGFIRGVLEKGSRSLIPGT